MSALMARHAASLIACGAAKSGNPCDKLTPPFCSFSRVISRMTDSVNCVAFFDPVNFDIVPLRPAHLGYHSLRSEVRTMKVQTRIALTIALGDRKSVV